MRLAGADRATWRTEQNRRRKDIEFLELLRGASVPVLLQLRKNHVKGPQWKRVAIDRALKREGWPR